MNVDPDGRRIQVRGAWASIFSSLRSNAAMGHVVRRLDDDPDIDCQVNEEGYAGLYNHGGAITDTEKTSGGGCSGTKKGWTITIDYNPQMMADNLQRNFGLTYSAEGGFIHELTHAYFDVLTNTENYPSKALSVQYENVVRSQQGLPLRPRHDP